MMQDSIRTVALLGTGLIGGSLGLVLRERRSELHVVAYDPSEGDTVVDHGAADVAAGSVAEAVRDADLVVLGAPMGVLPGLLREIAPHLQPGAIVTDVGSVKTPLVAYAAEVLPAANPFVGGHPMAGAERGGLAHADPFLFENATWVLCPPEGIAEDVLPEQFEALIDLVRVTGARVLLLDAERHDRIAALVSHVPQLVAVLLMTLAAESNDDDDAFLRLAAGGFRDMTRIASSPFELWREILLANEGPVLDALARLADALQATRYDLASNDFDALAERFVHARTVRNTIPKDTKGFLAPLADVYVYAEDRPGFLLRLVQTLYDAGLNIKDIELLKIREGTGGAFRFGFATASDADQAVVGLSEAGYSAYRL
ncbi:MAG: prephenate dehydrogenase [Bacteroidota bacterium]